MRNPFGTRAIRMMAIRQQAKNEFHTRGSAIPIYLRQSQMVAIRYRTSWSVKTHQYFSNQLVVYQSAWMQQYLIINAVCLSAGL